MPTPGTGDGLSCRHAPPPACTLPLMRTAVASLCAVAALMVASALVLTAVAVTVGYEPRAAGVGAPSHMPRLPCLIEDVRGSGRVSRSATPACGHPYTWAGSTADAWAGAVDTTGRNHEDTRTPSRLCRTGWIPALSYTRRAILVTLGVAPAFVKPAPQQQDVREREHRHALVVGGDGFEAASFDP